ncbi:hypothetical protein GPALN_005470 [Globodera pallida]|uniref:Tyrosine-protein phosphatase domain-containing protein n=1 Tax=Globodera pallida TaxID=36090 RepID=A0A183CAB4_GLOPA|nr:hypothetical protein GPALN_005470 [Globodera pallida]
MLANIFSSRGNNQQQRSLRTQRVAKSSAAAFELQERLTRPGEISQWLLGSCVDPLELFGNRRVTDFFKDNFDGNAMVRRFKLHNKNVENDKDRIRLHGQYYNNIYLGKRIFGPARKQVFNYTIVGGMERRFEIVDNQVNHIQFTHEHSDKFSEKCRNQRIKCKDESRVVLRYPSDGEEPSTDSFIHANYVRSPVLFNDFIVTQAPLDNTIGDFWRMIWQEKVCYIFMLISRKEPNRCVPYWPKSLASKPLTVHGLIILNEGIEPSSRDPFFRVTKIRIIGRDNTELRLEHWQADMNNSENVEAPLRLLRLSRSCTAPTVVLDYLGISRASCIIAAEICICQLIRGGPMCKYVVQQAVHYLRSFRPFSVETPMQYIFIHRVVQHFIRPFVGVPVGFEQDYVRWLDERSQRLFVDDFDREIPAFRLLSPRVDPDLLPLVRRRERPELRREMHAPVGELPLPAEMESAPSAGMGRDQRNGGDDPLANIQLPKRYPRGRRY